jgi:hypothetical protein
VARQMAMTREAAIGRQRQQETIPLLVEIDVTQYYRGPARVRGASDANILLERNTRNPRLGDPRKAHVEYLTRVILEGEWRADHPDSITFGCDGDMKNGQHRMLAIAMADREVVVTVFCGAPNDIGSATDVMTPRRLFDCVEFSRERSLSKTISALVTFGFGLSSADGFCRKRPTPAEAEAFFIAHSAAIAFVADGARGHKRGCPIPVLFAVVELAERDRRKASEFLASFLNPDGMVQPARRLRELCLVSRLAGRGSRVSLYEKAVGAARAHLEGRTLSKIYARAWEA